MHVRPRLKRTLLLVSTLSAVVGIQGSAAASARSHAQSPVNLVLWQNLGNGNQAQAVPLLINAFEKTHPGITITNVAQPRANYFALLQAAAVSQSGPDIVNMWTGLFTMQYRSYLENLKSWVPASDIKQMGGTKWSSLGFNNPAAPYVIPLQQQFYIGFYNKALFARAGIKTVPTTWNQLFAACARLKSIHKTCIEEGTQNLTGEFYPWYNLSYLMAGVFSPAQWEGLYNGKIPWTNPTVEGQLAKWHQLYADGYLNRDALTATNVQSAFLKGQAAIIVKGNWDTSQFTQSLGSRVGVFVPPFSNSPMNKVVEFAGNGFAMTSYSSHKKQVAEFLQFMTSKEAGAIMAQEGLIPAVNNVRPTNPLAKTMVNLVAKDHFTVYPMLDNVTAPGIVNAGDSVFPDMLVGGTSVKHATSSIEQSWKQLPTSERAHTWADYSVPA
ncbi:MAG: ABC transporter substrate-binding protein [Actinomycetota bacterium]|nr:ABC transporter substrate-binding protein [Actinomycetota bacterium]